MKKSVQSIFLVFIFLPVLAIGCAFASSLVSPSPTDILKPSETTLNGKFEFFDVTLDQASKDTINISFGYQIDKNVDTSELQIMATPQRNEVNCSIKDFTTNSKPYILKGDVSNPANSGNTNLKMETPAKCTFEGLTLIVFRLENSNPVVFYEQDFKITFTLEKQ